jgi:hypothetical protein
MSDSKTCLVLRVNRFDSDEGWDTGKTLAVSHREFTDVYDDFVKLAIRHLEMCRVPLEEVRYVAQSDMLSMLQGYNGTSILITEDHEFYVARVSVI